MKLFIAVAALFFAPTAFASDKFFCVNNANGLKYEVITQFGEIHEYTAEGEYIGHADSLDTQVEFIETFPPMTVTTMRHEEGDIVAEIIESESGITMSFYEDKDISCVK